MPDFSERLKTLMDAHGLNQADVAVHCDISEPSISRYISGRTPKAHELHRLAQFFGVSMEWLLTGGPVPTTAAVLKDDGGQTAYRTARERAAERLTEVIAELNQITDTLNQTPPPKKKP